MSYFSSSSSSSSSSKDRGYELITLSCYKPDPSTYLSGFDIFTSNIGFIIYGLFTFICVTVLINTLIAMLEETIREIDDRADIEWKFARSKLYMEYIRNGEFLLRIILNIEEFKLMFVVCISRKYFTCSNESLSNTNINSKYFSSNKTNDLFK